MNLNEQQKLLLSASDNLAMVSKKLIEAIQYLSAANDSISRFILMQNGQPVEQ